MHTTYLARGALALLAFAAMASADCIMPHAWAQDAAPAPPAVPAKASKAKSKAKTPAPPAEDAAAAAAAKDPASATRSYNTGVAAYQAGKFDVAVQSMNAAVQSGGLPVNLLAKALYYRGAAYQQQGKAGQAISDLTSALWLKNGLDETERADASRLRSAAYRDSGLGEQGQVAGQSGGAQVSSLSSSTITTGSIAPTTAGPSLNAVQAEGSATQQQSPLGGLGNLFGNLFSSSSPDPSPAPAAPSSALAEKLVAPTPPKPAPDEVLPWADKPAERLAAKPVAPAAAAAVAPRKSATATPAATGKIMIQVAAVKTRDEASEIIAKVQAQGGVLATAASSVDEAAFGTMGTFYRVRIGPYASAAATKAPCAALKAASLDCLVTAK